MDTPETCPACQAERDGLRCGACGHIPAPDPHADHFRRLGLARRFAQDPAELAERRRTLLGQVHPDLLVGAPDVVRRNGAAQATRINDAARVLGDPVRRAEYLLTLRGLTPLGDGHLRFGPQSLLEALELREALSELRGVDAHVERARLSRSVIRGFERARATLGERLDAPTDEVEGEELVHLAARLRILRGVLDDLDELSTI